MSKQKEAHRDRDWDEGIKQAESQHVVIFKTAENNQLPFGERRHVVWIQKKSRFQSHGAQRTLRRTFSLLNEFALRGTSSSETPKTVDLSPRKEIIINLGLI